MFSGAFPATVMPDAEWWEALWPRPEAVVEEIGVAAGTDAIDLCCGDGLFTVPLAAMARQVIAIDLDPAMLERAQARTAAAGVKNCAFIAADAYDVARVVAASVDLVLIANTFHGVPDKPRLARAVASVLRPGGRFAVINWHRRPREETTVLGSPRGPKTEMRMTPEEVAAAVGPVGFRALKVVELPPYHYVAILALPDV
ncbi:MAG: class I SAM-dependent methyltransferase [Rhodospirillales bacterium]|nr:class I SAM-dependent methyltransferase [Rhodospirillales bacterium]